MVEKHDERERSQQKTILPFLFVSFWCLFYPGVSHQTGQKSTIFVTTRTKPNANYCRQKRRHKNEREKRRRCRITVARRDWRHPVVLGLQVSILVENKHPHFAKTGFPIFFGPPAPSMVFPAYYRKKRRKKQKSERQTQW